MIDSIHDRLEAIRAAADRVAYGVIDVAALPDIDAAKILLDLDKICKRLQAIEDKLEALPKGDGLAGAGARRKGKGAVVDE